MDDTTILGGALNQLGQAAKQTVKQVAKIPEEMAADLAGQITGAENSEPKQPATNASQPALNDSRSVSGKNDAGGEDKSQKQWQSDEERIKFLRDLYGGSDPTARSEKKLTEFQEQIKDKSPEEQKKLIELRNQLHKDVYYDPTFNPPKKQEEERPAEKVEKEKKQEMQDLQQKQAENPPPLAVVREQNKAEQFRGAAG